jgi:predicted ATPase/DNA-binding winged helix-turn-helix (wHTH) protein
VSDDRRIIRPEPPSGPWVTVLTGLNRSEFCGVSKSLQTAKLVHSSMETTASEVRFGTARLDLARRRLLINEVPARLGARAFDVLVALVERRDRAVGKNELFELVWPGVIVEENNLQVHISALRKLLGPQTIATIPGRGYRFTASVSSPPDSVAVSVPTVTPKAEETEPLYGRAEDLRAVSDLLRQHPLVSIVGAGGIGKTRLARTLAVAAREHFSGGTWWVELSQLSDGAAVPAAIGQALCVGGSENRPVLQTISALLRHGRSLLVLDNCEHVLDAAADSVRALLADVPDLRVMVTSQEPLRLPAEHVYRLGGLASDNATETPAAVSLFVARARAADPRLQPTRAQLVTIADICRRLDGMPLAIELAAARVRLLGIDGLRGRLDERFNVLTGGTRSVLRRHQTLRATLDWSHQLLSAEERAVFRRLGVFVGGFSLVLAQAVAADERLDRWKVLDLLGHLVDKSLVVADGGEAPRYRLLETTRAFALEQLAAANETPLLLRAHAEAMLAFVQHVEGGHWRWSDEDQKRQAAELDNVRAAIDWAASATDTRNLACALFANSRRLWLNCDLMNEGIACGKRLMPLPDGLDLEVEARFSLTLAHVGYMFGPHECFVAALRANELFRSLGDTVRLIDSLIWTVMVGAHRGDSQHRVAALAEADALIENDAPSRQKAALALAYGRHFAYLGDYASARPWAERQAAIYRQSGDEIGEQMALSTAAWYGCALGRIDEAIPVFKTAIATYRRLSAPHGIGVAQQFLANAHALRGEREEALSLGRAAIPYLQRTQMVASLVPFIALLHAQRPGAETNAAMLIGFFDVEVQRSRRPLPPFVIDTRDRVMTLVQAALGAGPTEQSAAAGAQLSEEKAIALMFDS